MNGCIKYAEEGKEVPEGLSLNPFYNNKIEFKNGSYIMGIDLANDSKIVRCERVNSFVYDDMIKPKWRIRWLRRFIEKLTKGE